uniref:Uncharacterized protein n=1 Tax=Megaselia scalaris TaxID=36166 RepID=T1GAC6_MEGSC
MAWKGYRNHWEFYIVICACNHSVTCLCNVLRFRFSEDERQNNIRVFHTEANHHHVSNSTEFEDGYKALFTVKSIGNSSPRQTPKEFPLQIIFAKLIDDL